MSDNEPEITALKRTRWRTAISARVERFSELLDNTNIARPLVVSCGTQHSESMVVVEPGGHVGRSLAGLSTCPRGGSSQRLS
jgi:hypothetical protein